MSLLGRAPQLLDGGLGPRTKSATRPIVATDTNIHDARPIHTHTRAKLSIAPACAVTPTAKLHAAYMPSGNTVDHRRSSNSRRGHRTSASNSTKSHSIVKAQSPMAMSL